MMSQAEFLKMYEDIRALPTEVSKLDRTGNKPDICKSLAQALKTLQIAEYVIAKQSDMIMATNAELLKQCEISRSANFPVVSPSFVTCGYPAAPTRKPSAIILKPNSDSPNQTNETINNALKSALKDFQVDRTRIAENGTVTVSLPSSQDRSLAVDNLTSALSGAFSVETPIDKIPKLIVTGVPDDIGEDNTVISSACAKNSYIAQCVEKGDTFEIERSWKPKHSAQASAVKNYIFKCSVNIRDYLINSRDGYIYLDLSRCKVQDYVNPIQCFHCYRYHHIAINCPDKNKPPICSACSGFHLTKDCRNENQKKCINCFRHKRNDQGHTARYTRCPSFVEARKLLLDKIYSNPGPINSNSGGCVVNSKN